MFADYRKVCKGINCIHDCHLLQQSFSAIIAVILKMILNHELESWES